MMRAKLGLWGVFVVALLSAACATPVTKEIWTECETVCSDRGGLMEACVEPFRGPGCHCEDDHIVWLDQLPPK